MFNVLSENGEVEEVEGDGGGRTGSPLALLPKPHLLSQETEMWLVGQQTQHYLEEEGSEGGRRERGRKKGEREEEVQKEFTAWSVELHSYSQFLTFHGLHEVFWALVDFILTSG